MRGEGRRRMDDGGQKIRSSEAEKVRVNLNVAFYGQNGPFKKKVVVHRGAKDAEGKFFIAFEAGSLEDSITKFENDCVI
jgi:hypothetical protein